MCIAIYKPFDKTISTDILRRCFKNNNEGCGFAFAENNQLHIEKGFFKFKKFNKYYSRATKLFPRSNFIIHFRIATQGKVDFDNCHPHSVNDKLCFIHNGILDNKIDIKDKSDTITFNETILKQLPDNFLNNSAIVELLSKAIGVSRIIFLDNTGKITILNEKLGIWDNDIWYSNQSYKYDYAIFDYPEDDYKFNYTDLLDPADEKKENICFLKESNGYTDEENEKGLIQCDKCLNTCDDICSIDGWNLCKDCLDQFIDPYYKKGEKN